jgi:hypothetical protein
MAADGPLACWPTSSCCASLWDGCERCADDKRVRAVAPMRSGQDDGRKRPAIPGRFILAGDTLHLRTVAAYSETNISDK